MRRCCSLIVFLLNALAVPCVAQTGCWEITALGPQCSPNQLLLVDCSGAAFSTWTVNGQSFSGDSVLYNVATAGNYNVSLLSVFSNGDTVVQSTLQPVGTYGDFTFNPTNICEEDTTWLTFQGTPTLVSWVFKVYDDNDSLLYTATPVSFQFWFPPYPIHTLPPGCYSFLFVVTNFDGCIDSAYKENYVCVDPIIADFSIAGNDSVSCPPLIATFENTSSCFDSAICNCIWDFGDGSPLVTGCHPTHTYLESGSFDVTMIINCGGASDTITKEDYIEVGGPFADITTIIDDPCGPVTVCYVLDSTNSVSFLFCPGNNTTCQTGPFDTLCITYDSLGAYEPSILICDNIGCCFEKFLDFVYVDSVHAAFGVLPNVVCGSDPVQFYNSSFSAIGTIASYEWNFGDGNTSALQNPTHSYADTGCYDVSMIATGIGGCADTAIETNVVCSVPDAGANIVATTPVWGCEPPFTVCFTDSPGNPNLAYQWSFPGAVTPTVSTQSACATYVTNGQYDVALSVMASNGCAETYYINDIVQFFDASASIYPIQPTLSVGDTAVILSTYDPYDPEGTFWSISPDSGAVFVLQQEDLCFIQLLEPGDYTVCANVEFWSGCVEQACTSINVSDSINAVEPLSDLAIIKLGPNPAFDDVRLTARSQMSERVSIDVFAMDGKMISTRIVDFHQGVNNVELDVSDLPNGVYTLQVKSKSFSENRKLVIQR